MTTQQQLDEAQEAVRLAELSKRGADEVAAEEGRKLVCARHNHELLIKGAPNRMQP